LIPKYYVVSEFPENAKDLIQILPSTDILSISCERIVEPFIMILVKFMQPSNILFSKEVKKIKTQSIEHLN
jgi:hypothetical protein